MLQYNIRIMEVPPEEEGVKKCKRCGEEKPLRMFNKEGAKKKANCKPCQAIIRRENNAKKVAVINPAPTPEPEPEPEPEHPVEAMKSLALGFITQLSSFKLYQVREKFDEFYEVIREYKYPRVSSFTVREHLLPTSEENEIDGKQYLHHNLTSIIKGVKGVKITGPFGKSHNRKYEITLPKDQLISHVEVNNFLDKISRTRSNTLILDAVDTDCICVGKIKKEIRKFLDDYVSNTDYHITLTNAKMTITFADESFYRDQLDELQRAILNLEEF